MKRIIATVGAALLAATSFAGAASADPGWRNDWRHGRWHHGHRVVREHDWRHRHGYRPYAFRYHHHFGDRGVTGALGGPHRFEHHRFEHRDRGDHRW